MVIFCECSADFRQQQLVVEWPENLKSLPREASGGRGWLLGNLMTAGPFPGRQLAGSFHRTTGPKVFAKRDLAHFSG